MRSTVPYFPLTDARSLTAKHTNRATFNLGDARIAAEDTIPTVGQAFELSGRVLYMSTCSHPTAWLEVCFDLPSPNENVWYPLKPGSKVRKPDGSPFSRVFVRQLDASTPTTSTFDVYLHADPDMLDQDGAISDQGNQGINRVTGSMTVDTELPDAAALADATANPTAPAVGGFLMLWNGATWDRVPGAAATGLLVNTELPAAAALADAAANPTAPAVGGFLMVWNGATWDRAPGAAATGLLVNTELPAAAALADGAANPTAPAVGGFLMLWNGATWDRAPGAAATGLLVNTELPAAAALADNMANPTAPLVGACLALYDGATWDRATNDTGAAGSGLRVAQATTPTATALQATAGAASGTIRASNARRRQCIVSNQDATQDVTLNFGAAAVVATHFRLQAGQSITVTTTQSITAIRNGAVDVTLYIIDEEY